MIKKLLILFLILTVFTGCLFFFWPLINVFFQGEFFEIKKPLPNIARITEKEIFTPPPLRQIEEIKDFRATLNQKEIIKWTNIEREKYGLLPLKENSTLEAMAETKIKDMFENQYFAHESPSGIQVGDLAKEHTYEFIAIGENLAMGIFQDDEKLVQAWMASPGHRENILSKTYQEIGIAVGKGTFEGQLVWLAVQHFGLPLTACPQPEESLKVQIEKEQEELKVLEESLIKIKAELQRIRPKWGVSYENKLKEYNDLVEKYNDLLEKNKIFINLYNTQVLNFNECVSGLK